MPASSDDITASSPGYWSRATGPAIWKQRGTLSDAPSTSQTFGRFSYSNSMRRWTLQNWSWRQAVPLKHSNWFRSCLLERATDKICLGRPELAISSSAPQRRQTPLPIPLAKPREGEPIDQSPQGSPRLRPAPILYLLAPVRISILITLTPPAASTGRERKRALPHSSHVE